ncbi:FecCD family ABC transporter permease [Roseovarius indicus]|uniref:FecCD family ABC transporter permease n=1 Tax=Roseovarius indicus TaxID=540747 RepID=UPI000ACA8CDE|nr:iron ABC transporter permease [Roseovarius indicus]
MRRALLVALLLAASVVLSLSTGVRSITLAEALSAVTAYDLHDPAHVTLMAIRLPRLVAGLVAGAALGVAGTVMQTLTRNPLADPGILGINAGAAFALLLGAAVLGRSDQGAVALLAFPGAALASLAVFSLGGGLRGEAGPVRLTLAGAALNALLLSMVTALVLIRQDSLDILRFWVAGSLTEAVYRPVAGMALVMLAGAALAFLIAPLIEALSMGADVARGLGTQPARVQAGGLVAVTLTTGAAVAIAGPIAFLGLMAPHLARAAAGASMRAQLLISAALGAIILTLADVAGRLVLAPGEVRAGIMVALLGGPLFIWIARRLRPGAMS